MKFLKAASAAANEPQCSIVDLMRKNVGGVVKSRSRLTVHASDVTSESFCARRVALFHLLEQTEFESYVDTTLQITFDVGNATADLFKEEWAGQSIVGHWKCRKCNAQRTFCTKPALATCKDFGDHDWKYREVVITDTEHDVVSSFDALMNLGSQKLFVTELKIMAPDQFKSLIAPVPEHRIRTQLYLRALANSDFVYKDKISLDFAKILYISRGHGASNKDHGGMILPFKEFMIGRHDDGCVPYLQRGLPVKEFKKTGLIPEGTCPSSTTQQAKTCPVNKACFSGKYPTGSCAK